MVKPASLLLALLLAFAGCSAAAPGTSSQGPKVLTLPREITVEGRECTISDGPPFAVYAERGGSPTQGYISAQYDCGQVRYVAVFTVSWTGEVGLSEAIRAR